MAEPKNSGGRDGRKSRSTNDLSRGDTVEYDGASEWRQPFEIAVVYHNDQLKLTNRYQEEIVSVAPERVTPA